MSQSVRKGLSDRISLFEQKKVESSLTVPTTRRKVSASSRNFSSIKDQFDKGQVKNRSPSVTPKTSVGSITDTEILQLQTVAVEDGTVSAATPENIDQTATQKKVTPKTSPLNRTPVGQQGKAPLQKKPSINNKASPKSSLDATPTAKATTSSPKANPTRPVTKSATTTIKPVATRVLSNPKTVVAKSSTTSFGEKSTTPLKSAPLKSATSPSRVKPLDSKVSPRPSASSLSKSVGKTSSDLTSVTTKASPKHPAGKFAPKPSEPQVAASGGPATPKTSIGSVEDGNARPAHRLPKQPVKEPEKSPKPILKNATTPPSTPKTSIGSADNKTREQPATPTKTTPTLKKSPPAVPPKPKKKLSFPDKVTTDIKGASSINATPAPAEDKPADRFEVQSPTPKAVVARPQFPDINSNLDTETTYKAPLIAKKSILKTSNSQPKPQPPPQVEDVEVRKLSLKSTPSSSRKSSTEKSEISSRKSSFESTASSRKSSEAGNSRRSSVQTSSRRTSVEMSSRKSSVETSSRKASLESSTKKILSQSSPRKASVEDKNKKNSMSEKSFNENEESNDVTASIIPDIVQDLQAAEPSSKEPEPPLVESVALHINLTKKNTLTRFELEKPNLQKSFSGLSFKAETLLEVSAVQKHEIQITGKQQQLKHQPSVTIETESESESETDSEEQECVEAPIEKTLQSSSELLLTITEVASKDTTNMLCDSLEDLPTVEITELPAEDDHFEDKTSSRGLSESDSIEVLSDLAATGKGPNSLSVPECLDMEESVVNKIRKDSTNSSLGSSHDLSQDSVENSRIEVDQKMSDLKNSSSNSIESLDDLAESEYSTDSIRSSVDNLRDDAVSVPAPSIPTVMVTPDETAQGLKPEEHLDFDGERFRTMSEDLGLNEPEPESAQSSCKDLRSLKGSSERLYRFDDFSSKAAQSSTTDDEVYALKRQKHDLEQKLKDEEDEVEDLVSQVQMLEQTKIKLESAISAIKKEHRNELAQKDEEIESVRVNAQKRMKILEDQLEADHEERIQFVREKHDLETKIMNLQQLADTSTNDDDYILKLKKDLKRSKALLKDAQSAMDKANQESSSKVVIRQLKNQLEDAEFARMAALKFRQNLELELSDVQHQLDDVIRSKADLEEKLLKMSREKADLSTQISETEEELQEVIRKFRASVAQLSVDQITIQDQVNRISDMEEEHFKLKEHITELNQKIETLDGESVTEAYQSRLELKIKELESKLELEQTTRARMETQINRLKEGIEKINSECDQLRLKDVQGQEQNRKLQRQIRDLREELADSQQKEVEAQSKKHEIEKQLELSEAEIIMAKNDLKLASKRIEDLQSALNAEIESDDDSQNSHYDSDSSDDSFMETISLPGIPKIRTTFVRDTMRSRHLETMAEEPEYQLLNTKQTNTGKDTSEDFLSEVFFS